MKTAGWTIVAAPVAAIYGRFWREAHWMLIGIALVVLASSVGAVATPYIFSRLIDALDAGRQLPAAIALMFVGYAIVRGLTMSGQYAVNFMSVMAAENLNFIAATSFFEKLLKKPVSFFIEHNPVEIQTARGEGQHSVYVLVQVALVILIPGITQIVLAIGLLGAVINFEIVLIVLVYGVIYVTATYFAHHWTRPYLDKAIEANQENAKFVGNAVNAMETLRYFNGDRWVSQSFAGKADEARNAWIGWSRRRAMLALIFGAAAAAQLAITFVLLLPRFAAGELSVGDIVLINTLLIQLNQPFEMLGMSINEVLRAYSSFLPFARMWNAPEDTTAGTTGPLRLTDGTLAFEHVSFGYGEKRTVTDVSFSARRGEITFLTGETGSGKSTLFKLALKAIEPQAGRITVDGIDLAGIGRENWYAAIGVVPQEVMLLNDTLAANIVLGRERHEARLRRAAERAAILAFIDALPEGFETTVGERGLKLSGGERQRIAIARALYADPDFLFLDEASSALDEATEAEIVSELRRLGAKVTILAITHRRSVIAAGDQVIALDGGSARADAAIGP
ncbi:ABC transporter ATP-binding protein [Devosia geojensis]|uniref:ABC transporter ATP-binding protein n=1 Tax=Devosia geojensis TaxID=443610 RepID=A0A0F5FX30_9HYPH|nr:ABC transporter ATP-binding protein [Devosia geojensis]KKB13393.1 ABC transporter ATP-binding protein [Devosia geojensis]